MVKINKCQTVLKDTINSLFSAVFFHHEFWTSSVMPRTNEVSFWTNIQTQGHKSARVRKVIHCGESHWLLASVLREQDRTIPLAREFWSSLENVSKIAALCYQVNNLNASQTYNDRSSTDCQGPWHALSPISKSTALSGSLISRGELGYQPLLPPLSGLLEATGNRKHVLLRLYPICEGI